MTSTQVKKPRIRILGDHGMEDVDYDSIPDPVPVAYHLTHYFKSVRISPRAIDLASKIIPGWYVLQHGGIHSILTKEANAMFEKMSGGQRSGTWGKMKFIFDFDKDGPVLKTVGLI